MLDPIYMAAAMSRLDYAVHVALLFPHDASCKLIDLVEGQRGKAGSNMMLQYCLLVACKLCLGAGSVPLWR